jgi:hypothetical protein
VFYLLSHICFDPDFSSVFKSESEGFRTWLPANLRAVSFACADLERVAALLRAFPAWARLFNQSLREKARAPVKSKIVEMRKSKFRFENCVTLCFCLTIDSLLNVCERREIHFWRWKGSG